MKPTFRSEAVIEAPAAVVWQWLTDWGRIPEWMAGVDSALARGETAVGGQVVFTARGKERSSEIVDCEQGRRIVLRSVQGSVVADYEYRLVPVDARSTRLVLTATCRTTGIVLKLLGPLLRLAIRLSDRGQPAALKRLVESAH